MTELYGNKWTSQYGKTPSELWVKSGMMIPEERFPVAMMRIRAERPEWPPGLPQFEKLCEVWPEEIGAPEVEAAFREACHGSYPFNRWPKWSHKAVYWAAVWTGQSDLADRPNQVRKEFEREYAKAIQCAETLEDAPIAALPERSSVIEPDVKGDGFQAFLKAKEQLS